MHPSKPGVWSLIELDIEMWLKKKNIVNISIWLGLLHLPENDPTNIPILTMYVCPAPGLRIGGILTLLNKVKEKKRPSIGLMFDEIGSTRSNSDTKTLYALQGS